jgi:HPt (histidine-containing phosphotransfer) domain-containing protein
MRGDQEKCFACGCSGYLSKPVQFDQLLDAVRSGIEGAPLDRADRQSLPALPSVRATDPAESTSIVSTLPTHLPKFQRIVDEFVTKLEEKLDAMHIACEAGDWDELARLAHWLKGSGGTVGFDCLTAPARELEQHAQCADRTGAKRALHELRSLMKRMAPVPV